MNMGQDHWDIAFIINSTDFGLLDLLRIMISCLLSNIQSILIHVSYSLRGNSEAQTVIIERYIHLGQKELLTVFSKIISFHKFRLSWTIHFQLGNVNC